jgi:alginate O-acetyltransferase complex protein AlgI
MTFTVATFAWIFFRAKGLSVSWFIITHLTKGFGNSLFNILHRNYVLDIGISNYELLIVIFAVIIMELIHLLQYKYSIKLIIQQQPILLRWGIYFLSLFVIAFFGIFELRQFIYFQF